MLYQYKTCNKTKKYVPIQMIQNVILQSMLNLVLSFLMQEKFHFRVPSSLFQNLKKMLYN